MRILLLHPEGNLNYNANLLGLLEILGEAGHRTTYVARRRPGLHQEVTIPLTDVTILDHPLDRGRFVFTLPESAADFSPWEGFDLVIGVDRGVIEAAAIARHFGIPHAYLSYEIFFREETDPAVKAPEVEACRDLAFAVTQDPLRSRMLCLANGIDPARIIQVPVSGRKFLGGKRPRPRLLHEMFGLHASARTALYAGSLADWTGAEFLLSSTRSWPEEWVLVVHERFGPAESTMDMVRAIGNPARVRMSTTAFADPGSMSEFVRSADLGIALYTPTYANEWVGLNIEHIGLASGKIATYLQHGVPTAVNELGEISDRIRYYGAGQVFSLERPFIPRLPSPEDREACRRLFENHLDLDCFGPAFLAAVEGARSLTHVGSGG